MVDHARLAPEKETSRLEAFSDGIFGVAITLLAIEIKTRPKPTRACSTPC